MKTLFVIQDNLEILIGVDGELFLKGSANYYDITNLDYSKYLLPLLEKNSVDFFKSISLNQRVNYLLLNQIVEKLIQFPFLNQMEYWSDLALNWMGSVDDFEYSWLHSIDTSWMSQKLKHKVMKVWNK